MKLYAYFFHVTKWYTAYCLWYISIMCLTADIERVKERIVSRSRGFEFHITMQFGNGFHLCGTVGSFYVFEK